VGREEEDEAKARERPGAGAAEGAAPPQAGAGRSASGSCHVARVAARVAFAIAAVLLADQRVLSARPGPVRFRLVDFSVQGNHMHMIVEARDETALARGMQGLGVRIAKALNRLMQRKGTVFADHYHMRILRSPTEVARALAYVLMNFLHHFPEQAAAYEQDRRDPCSSAWRERGRDPPVVAARTWLLSIGWQTRASGRLLSLVGQRGSG
jgi:hypothetical protein